jgi:hypothetical protein
MITKEWVQPVDQAHRLFRVSSDLRDDNGAAPITAYAVLRPDGQWSLLIVNRDHDKAQSVSVAFRDGGEHRFAGPVTQIVFGAAQYQWNNREENSFAKPDGPAVTSEVVADGSTKFEIPKASVVVLRGMVQ